ncbi:MAG: hypothetical protein P0Y53_12145 [Candidatus Pseudobacter hemicellulosilyticus]|uniref:Uncharacterized protein n=1 Tax=Candidatus Pseudobacter hemicellulosilyticus TaxID=3121375 RepID=A0AAJ5WXY4_9BACT|nr:MAG: hypothetical protein P0Y53_12145 [Pseudobacter sp.]
MPASAGRLEGWPAVLLNSKVTGIFSMYQQQSQDHICITKRANTNSGNNSLSCQIPTPGRFPAKINDVEKHCLMIGCETQLILAQACPIPDNYQ